MKTRRTAIFVTGAAVICAGAFLLWRSVGAGKAHGHAPKVAYYQDSMHPWIKSDKPGKCTVCAMDLTPILEGSQGFDAGSDTIVLSSNNITVLNVQTEEAQRRPLRRALRVAGTIEASETKRTVVSAPAVGRVDSLFVDYVGVEVQRGDPLVTFYSPGFANQTRRFAFLGGLARPAQRLQADGEAHVGARMAEMDVPRSGPASMSPSMDLRKGLDTSTYFTELLAPQSGTVVERFVYTGQYVQEGEKMFTIVDSSVLWFRFDVYEQHLTWLETGQKLQVTVQGLPGKVFPATVAFIEPTINEATRTVRVRADIVNPLLETEGGGQTQGARRRLLHYGMYAEGRLQAQGADVLSVSRSAVLLPGDRAYAYVETDHGVYERRELKLGRQGDDHWEVVQGLDEGDRVVTSGNVLIDAQAQFNRTGDAQEETPSEPQAAGMAAGHRSKSAVEEGSDAATRGTGLSEPQQKALAGFLAAADGVSQALAADRLDQLKPHLAKLPAVTQAAEQALGPDHPWQPLLKQIRTAAPEAAPADLDAARKAFLPFSTNVVALVQQVRAQEESFRSLKVYYCSMAPKPGLWFQSQGPLRNPYYGAEMLTCGKEVKLASAPASAAAAVSGHSTPSVSPTPSPAATAAPVASHSQRGAAILASRHSSNHLASASQTPATQSRDRAFFGSRVSEALAARLPNRGTPATNAPRADATAQPTGAEAPAAPASNPSHGAHTH